MKYTRSESGEVVEVKGCAKCPHVVTEQQHGFTVMFCTKGIPGQGKKHKKLTSHWTGPYRASCPLPSEAGMVPSAEVGK